MGRNAEPARRFGALTWPRITESEDGGLLRATISEVKNDLSGFLRQVKRGETVLVLERKVPVACIVPPGHAPDSSGVDARAKRLEETGIVVRRGAGSPLDVLGQPAGSGAAVLEALLEERREGR